MNYYLLQKLEIQLKYSMPATQIQILIALILISRCYNYIIIIVIILLTALFYTSKWTSTNPEQWFYRVRVHKSNDAVVPGQAGAHHENAHSTDEGSDVTHVGKAVPLKQKKIRNTCVSHFWLWTSVSSLAINGSSDSDPLCNVCKSSHLFTCTYGWPGSGLRTDWLIPTARRAWRSNKENTV